MDLQYDLEPAMRPGRPPRVALFVTCLVDLLFPQVGESTVAVLDRLGIPVAFPKAQTCCGQVAFTTGYANHAREAAARLLDAFEGAEAVVAPSGSCAGMVRRHYPSLLAESADLEARARELASRTYELSEFLVRVMGIEDVGASLPRPTRVTYHDGCHALRELGVAQEPRALIRAVRGAELVESAGHDVCCGFGGLFSVKYPEISSAILREKVQGVRDTGASLLVTTEPGCLMQMGGFLSRQGPPAPRALHLAEFLASGVGA